MMTKRLSALLSMLVCTLLVLPVMAADKGKSPTKKGTVIFYRTRNAKGGAIRLRVTDGSNTDLGHLTNGSKLVKEWPVGEATFVVTSPSIAGRDSVTLQVEAGKTYYIKGQALMGWPAARPKFTLMDEAKGKADSDKIKK